MKVLGTVLGLGGGIVSVVCSVAFSHDPSKFVIQLRKVFIDFVGGSQGFVGADSASGVGGFVRVVPRTSRNVTGKK